MLRFRQWWRDAGVFLERLPVDRRAQKLLYAWVMLLLFWAVILYGCFQDLTVLIALPFMLAITIRAVKQPRLGAHGHLSLGTRLPARLSEGIAHRPAVEQRLLLEAARCARASSEYFLRHQGGEVPPHWTQRQMINGMLRSERLWDVLDEEERDLMMLPDSAWPPDAPGRYIRRNERVRTLRWILGVDRELEPMRAGTTVHPKMFLEVCEQPTRISGTGCAALELLRFARDEAYTYFNRALAEGLRRGTFQDEQGYFQDNLLIQRAMRLSGKQSEDLLWGEAVITDISDDDLRTILQLSITRAYTIQGTLTYLYGLPEWGLYLDPEERPAIPSGDVYSEDHPDNL